jgi:hypothetical protein
MQAAGGQNHGGKAATDEGVCLEVAEKLGLAGFGILLQHQSGD